jgi:hypothetical protein
LRLSNTFFFLTHLFIFIIFLFFIFLFSSFPFLYFSPPPLLIRFGASPHGLPLPDLLAPVVPCQCRVPPRPATLRPAPPLAGSSSLCPATSRPGPPPPRDGLSSLQDAMGLSAIRPAVSSPSPPLRLATPRVTAAGPSPPLPPDGTRWKKEAEPDGATKMWLRLPFESREVLHRRLHT